MGLGLGLGLHIDREAHERSVALGHRVAAVLVAAGGGAVETAVILDVDPAVLASQA